MLQNPGRDVTSAKARTALLRCLANPDSELAAWVNGFDAAEWSELIDLAIMSRTQSILRHCIMRSGLADPMPYAVAAKLEGADREAALVSLAQGRQAVQTVRSLHEAGFAPIALKGAALAYGYYPVPALRQMRDIDLLLPADQAIEARALLLGHGFRPHPNAARYGLEKGHQLPELYHPESGLLVEIHHRLGPPEWKGETLLRDRVFESDATICILGEIIRVPDAASNLLHLAEHATLHHLFANGPVILTDLHYLHASGKVDWGAVSRLAPELGLERSLSLLAAIAGRNGAQWPEAMSSIDRSISHELAAAAVDAMLSSEETHRQQAQLARQNARKELALIRALKPDPTELARIGGHDPASASRWFGYPRWLVEKGGRYLRSRFNRSTPAKQARRAALAGWLHGEELPPGA
ncbi:hypothetical protein AMC99_00169 [Altererythrobacter epoxidivorans]|uniref:Nucleotidyltransferase family protein n=1 Tax=Altererythrobacter epoxidivorans TaxID=361183 RepID=A0A0M4M5U3_9SPHN|nr:nucleotidyltransferase family protein [Altererythrobacter epoxidivorans]ALE15485.1 hypothetical protein AMC99_00169 [Altererythrobacter epoxidivorans]